MSSSGRRAESDRRWRRRGLRGVIAKQTITQASLFCQHILLYPHTKPTKTIYTYPMAKGNHRERKEAKKPKKVVPKP